MEYVERHIELDLTPTFNDSGQETVDRLHAEIEFLDCSNSDSTRFCAFDDNRDVTLEERRIRPRRIFQFGIASLNFTPYVVCRLAGSTAFRSMR